MEVLHASQSEEHWKRTKMILLEAKIVGLEAVDATRALEVDIEAVAGAALLAAG